MRVYLVHESDLQRLTDRLELSAMRGENVISEEQLSKYERTDAFRAFRFVVQRWLGEIKNPDVYER
jgi:hypothetical protein